MILELLPPVFYKHYRFEIHIDRKIIINDIFFNLSIAEMAFSHF